MRFVCEGRECDTDEFDRVYTGNTRVPLVLISRDRREVLFVEQGRPEGLSVRRATEEDIASLARRFRITELTRTPTRRGGA